MSTQVQIPKTQQREIEPKKYRRNPFLTWTSTFEERHATTQVALDKNCAKTGSVQAWLDHLKSPLNSRGKSKSPLVRKKDLQTYEKFWRIANGRGILKQLFETGLNECEISERMREAGFVGIVHEQIRQIRKSWCPNRKTRDTEANRHRRIVLAAVAEHPEWTFKRIGQEAGVGPRDAQAVIEAAGIKKPNTRFVTPEERRAREQFLIDARIEYFPHDIKFGITSVAYMKDRVLHMLEAHEYTVRRYWPFLACTTGKTDTSIETLDSYQIDWRDEEKGLWRLIVNSPKYIHDQMELLEDIGASPELHYLLLKKLSGRFKHYSSDKPLYVDLRRAVVENDVQTILDNARRCAYHTIENNGHTAHGEYFDLAQDTAIIVLSECSRPQNNPAAFLSLTAAAIEVAIKNKAMECAMTDSIEDFSSGENTRPKRKWKREKE